MVAGFCLTLEYAISGYGVATSWGSKLAVQFKNTSLSDWDGLGFSVNFGAGIVTLVCTLVLLRGLTMGKMFTNVMTILKCVLVAFMIVIALAFFDLRNFSPFIPPRQKGADGDYKFGIDGMLQGTVQGFFCFIGFDEVCCMAGEAKDPKRDMPKAVFLSVLGTALFTGLAAVGLAGMLPYTDINPDAGFAQGFEYHGLHWAAQITSWGELICLPVVVFVCILPQARLFYAMSMDGLLPRIFTKLSDSRVLVAGNLIIGGLGMFQALLLDFDTIADLTSAGVLLSFILCNCSLIMLTLTKTQQRSMELEAPDEAKPNSMMSTSFSIGGSTVEIDLSPEDRERRKRTGKALGIYCVFSFFSMILLAGIVLPSTVLGSISAASTNVRIFLVVWISIVVCAVITLIAFVMLATTPHSQKLGTIWAPCLGILFNNFMLSSLSQKCFYQFIACFAVVICFYFLYSIRHSAGNHAHWVRKSLIESKLKEPSMISGIEANEESHVGTNMP